MILRNRGAFCKNATVSQNQNVLTLKRPTIPKSYTRHLKGRPKSSRHSIFIAPRFQKLEDMCQIKRNLRIEQFDRVTQTKSNIESDFREYVSQVKYDENVMQQVLLIAEM